MAHIINPRSGDRTVDISQISKEQLALALNEQSERFKAMRKHLDLTIKILVAITLEPEAFTYADGRRTIAAAALAKVKSGMSIAIDGDDEKELVLRVIDVPKSTVEQIPNIVMPKKRGIW